MNNLEIDPALLGSLEAGWWKAHNDHDREKMGELLIKEHIALYSLSPTQALEVVKILALSTVHHDSHNWEETVKLVTQYYEKLKEYTGWSFDPLETAQLEVGWWKIHDELEHNPNKIKLAEAFSKLYASIFGINSEKLKTAGNLKAQATYEHDLAEDPQTPREEVEGHWQKAEELLTAFYQELKTA